MRRNCSGSSTIECLKSVNEKFEVKNIEKKKKSRSLETLLVHSYSWHVIEAVLSADDGTRLASQAGRRHHRQQIWILGTGPLPYYFASNNTWIVTINHQKYEFSNSVIHSKYKNLISNSYSTAMYNGTAIRKTGVGAREGFAYHTVRETGFTG
jgi:hypothetical protein